MLDGCVWVHAYQCCCASLLVPCRPMWLCTGWSMGLRSRRIAPLAERWSSMQLKGGGIGEEEEILV